jgi:hypothetical protein
MLRIAPSNSAQKTAPASAKAMQEDIDFRFQELVILGAHRERGSCNKESHLFTSGPNMRAGN